MSSATRLTQVLSLFTLKRPAWTPLAAAKSLGISRASAYRYFSILLEAGFINDSVGSHCVLGPRIIELDRQIRLSDPLVQVAVDEMVSLAKQTGGVALLCRVHNRQVVCIHQESEPASAAGVSHERGRSLPLYRGAASKIILAHLQRDELELLVRRDRVELANAGLPADAAELYARLQPIRDQRLCTDTGELDPGRCAVAVPVCHGTVVVGSLSLVLPGGEADAHLLKSASSALQTSGLRIEAELEQFEKAAARRRRKPRALSLESIEA